MHEIIRTDSSSKEFTSLAALLDSDLNHRNGADQEFYHQFNSASSIKHVVIYYSADVPVGCGAIKPWNDNSAEVKRMFVLPGYRGRGIAQKILEELEKWAKELGYSHTVLETGIRQPEAIGLYRKCGYTTIPNYGQYKNVETSVCMSKKL